MLIARASWMQRERRRSQDTSVPLAKASVRSILAIRTTLTFLTSPGNPVLAHAEQFSCETTQYLSVETSAIARRNYHSVWNRCDEYRA